MTPDPSPTALLSVELPLDYWYETPVGWAVVAVVLFAFAVAAVIVVRLVKALAHR